MKVSVIITCFNLEDYISRSITSCLNQTMSSEDYEIIVVDDYSGDNSWNIINNFQGLVIPLKTSSNSGVSAASNMGIRQSKGKYIVRVDGDDFINKNFLHSLYEILEWNDDIGFVYCDHIIVKENRERFRSINTLEKLLDNGAGIMFRKKYIESIGLYDENLRNREDYDLLLRYIKNFNGYHLRLPYYRYFKRSGSLTTFKEERATNKLMIDTKILKNKTNYD
tara:strand:+ start:864 stop:1532 length:669 start_codon:yes stop_codon:yes gene_type:complete